MKLFTKEIEKKLQSQYPQGSSFNQKVICKIFNPIGSWSWYAMNQDPEDPDYLWGIVKGWEVEMGSFSKSDLENHKGNFGLPLERDLYFVPEKAEMIWKKLLDGEMI